MLLSSQALWPLKNSAVAHFWVMAHRLKTSGLCYKVKKIKLNPLCAVFLFAPGQSHESIRLCLTEH